MLILGLDTSADDTAAAVSKNDRILSNIRSSQIDMHEEFGGIVPSIARRAHKANISRVVAKALKQANVTFDTIDAIAVTIGPGLAIALEVAIDYVKKTATTQKIIGINHIAGHVYANWAKNRNGNPKDSPEFPLIALIISGGHTELLLMDDHLSFEKIGKTLDDAAGEAFDKVGRMLGFGYPSGAIIEEVAKSGNPEAFEFPRPMEKHDSLDFSFSGLKTAVMYEIKNLGGMHSLSRKKIADIAASFQQAVFDSLLIKTVDACKKYTVKRLVLGGGVVANITLRRIFRKELKKIGVDIFTPPLPNLSTDNAAMIAVAGYYYAQYGRFIADVAMLDRDPIYSVEDM